MKFTTLIIAIFILSASRACDVCPCVPGGGMSGIYPQFRQHFAGLRYQFRSFSYKQPGDPSADARMIWHGADLMGRYTPVKNVQLMATIPLLYGIRKENTQIYHNSGLGDISLQGSVFLINPGENKIWKHFLSAGAGIKLPTGFSRVQGVPASLQTTTGAFDYMINSTWILRHRRTGLMQDINYRYACKDARNYQGGQRLTWSARLFYWKTMGINQHFVPHIFSSVEYAGKDVNRNYYVKKTGGYSVFSGAGVDYFTTVFSLSLQGSIPVFSKMNDGITLPEPRFQTSFLFYF
ncbi:MAG: hypothetical protein JNL57_04305 [Bacteroidetes bacterium]|nr:hypothetical protein [Bacteroidota bacterium]